MKNERFITKGVDLNVSPLLQLFMWECVRATPLPKDYLQIFEIEKSGNKLKIIHSQEEPVYRREYLLCGEYSFLLEKFMQLIMALIKLCFYQKNTEEE